MTDAEPTESGSAAESKLVDLAMDLFVYAPLGAMLEFSDRLPALAERGREKFEAQAPAAKMVGQFAVGAGRKKAEDQLGDVIGKGKALLQELGVLPGSPTAQATAATDDPPVATTGEDDRVDANAQASIGDVIIGYCEMTAVNIVPLLSSLDGAQRATVRAFEAAHRARRTIIARLDQLDDSNLAE